MSYQNILIVKLSAIGDVIHALPVPYALKQQYPEARITWVVEKAAYDLLTNNPYIDELLLFEKAKCKTVWGAIKYAISFAKELRKRHFDLALDLQGLFKSAAISWLSGAKKKLVYCNARELSDKIGTRICGEHTEGHVVERYLDVARYVGCRVNEVIFPLRITETEARKAEATAVHAGLRFDKPYVVLAPGTNWRTKCWPTEHFAALADKLYENNIIPVLVGGKSDQRLAEAIIQQSSIPPVDLTGKTALKELAHIIKHAKAFVGGDTGPMHLAVAAGTPVITLFGPTDPARNGPYGGNGKVLVTPLECRGCWQRICADNKDCMEKIHPDEVYRAFMAVQH
ncbi:MAG: lipopolysaccharide heptosyltransferase II [Pelosinus sp.]|nr:lipopolysaccharide heptosyltransferase II [Pelosinus sp.]